MVTKKQLLLLAVICFQSQIIAQTNIWTGNGGDSNWFNAANWSANSIPSSADDVLIASAFTVEIEANTANSSSIELQNSATLIVNNNLVFSNELTIDINATLDWISGSISGGGSIQNEGLINLTELSEKLLVNTTLNNNNIVQAFNIGFIRLNDSPTINNSETGIFEIIGTGSLTHQTGSPVFNNDGLVKKTSAGIPTSTYMIFEMNNYGIIDIEDSQTFLFLSPLGSLTNYELGRIQGFGAYDITSPFVTPGTISPGGDQIGTLEFVNNFDLTSQTKLEFDLGGTSTGDYDVLAIIGFPNLQGNILINLEYTPQMGDEFTIITANNISSCNFPAQVIDNNGGPTDFLFDVICDNTSVVLRFVDEIILGFDDLSSEEIDFFVHPNPISETFQIVFNSQPDLVSSDGLSLKFYNTIGQEVRTIEDFSEVNNTFQRGNLSKGLYFIQLKSQNEVLATTKILFD